MKRLALSFSGALFLAGCGDPGQLGRSVVSPSDVTTKVALEDVPVTGAEVKIVRVDESSVTGELLEATDDRVTILKGSSIVALEANDIRSVLVTRYENGTLIAILGAWSAVIGISQISHGVFLVITGPIWGGISTGAIIPVAADEGRFAHADKRSDFLYLREYARFPQGLPPQYARRK
jgi:hypothetical protein